MSETDSDRPVVGITMGDPAGIGPEIIAAGHPALCAVSIPLVIGDLGVMRRAIDAQGVDRSVRPVTAPTAATDAPETIDVLDLDNVEEHRWGALDAAAGQASLEFIERAIRLAQAGAIAAIVTAPIHKQAIRLAGAEHAGHTGLLAERTETDAYTMLLIEGQLRVAHVSTHVPLPVACDRVTTARVGETIRLTAAGLGDLGIADPRIGVAGLNPHAGDGGVIGTADGEAIAPAVAQVGEEGIDAVGPRPPDTVFVDAIDGAFDAVVAMYHDQGHIPIKLRGFADGHAVSGVNVTLGLPIVRTSVDHGTAYDIAGTGTASPRSLIEAIEIAVELAATTGGA